MDFSKLLHGFVEIDIWISLSCFMDLSKLIFGFVLVITWICQSCYLKLLYLFAFAKQNQAEVWPRSFCCELEVLNEL